MTVRNIFGSMANRVFLILLAGILVAVTATTYLAAHERRITIDDLRNQHVADRVEQLVMAFDGANPELRLLLLQEAAAFGIRAALVDKVEDGADSQSDLVTLLRARLGE